MCKIQMLMMLCHLMVFSVSLLPIAASMKQPATPCPPASGDNAMANTYGFLRKSSNTVGSAVENVLGIEGSLDDMHKDLDEEYKRWMMKKKDLVSDKEKLKSEIARAKDALLQQKKLREEKERFEGRIKIEKGQNDRREASLKDSRKKAKAEQTTLEEEIKTIQCQTANIERIKQERVEAANKKTSILKDNNRLLQQNVFQLNKELNNLTVNFTEMKIQNNATVSKELGKIEAVQKQLHALEEALVAQAQLEEAVQRARERVEAQTTETVKQRTRITEAQSKCATTKKTLEHDIEASKQTFNSMNDQMAQCQQLDGTNQRLQAELNQCILRKRSMR